MMFPPGIYEVAKIHSGKSAWVKFGVFPKEVFSGDRFEVHSFIPCSRNGCEGKNICPGRAVVYNGVSKTSDGSCFVFYNRYDKQSYFGLHLIKEHIRWKDGRLLRRMELRNLQL